MVLVVSVLVGWLSYSFIERPASQRGGVFGRDGRLLRPFTGKGDDPVEWESFRSGNPF